MSRKLLALAVVVVLAGCDGGMSASGGGSAGGGSAGGGSAGGGSAGGGSAGGGSAGGGSAGGGSAGGGSAGGGSAGGGSAGGGSAGGGSASGGGSALPSDAGFVGQSLYNVPGWHVFRVAQASAFLMWVESNNVNGRGLWRVMRMLKTGGAPAIVAELDAGWPEDLQFTGGNVFWADNTEPTGKVWRVPLAGGTPSEWARADGGVRALAAVDGQVYWAPLGPPCELHARSIGSTTDTLIRRCGTNRLWAVSVSDAGVDYATDGTIERVLPDGGATVIATGSVWDRMASERNRVVFQSLSGDTVLLSAPADGGPSVALTRGIGLESAVGERFVYAINTGDAGELVGVSRLGGAVETIVRTNPGLFSDLVADRDVLFVGERIRTDAGEVGGGIWKFERKNP